MAPKTRDGINPAVNAVPGQIVAAVRHPAVGASLIFNRGLQLSAGNMTVIAKTLLVAHIANPGTPTRLVAVLVRKVNGVVVRSKMMLPSSVSWHAVHKSFLLTSSG